MASTRPATQLSELMKGLVLNSPGDAKTIIPKLIYGTAWKKERTADLVYKALKHGFRALDTAAQPKHYDEAGVGAGFKRAITEGIIKREDVFIQTKFTSIRGQGDNIPYDTKASLEDQVHQSVLSSLDNFTVANEEPYLDSLVLHSPLETFEDTLTVWRTLESYVPTTIRNLGISNVTLPILVSMSEEVTHKPAMVQNRFFERTDYDVDMRAFCREAGIVFQSFWTLSANPKLVQHRIVDTVAKQAGVSKEVAFYALVLGLGNLTILDGTTSEAHMKEDLEGINKVGLWAEQHDSMSWNKAMAEFKKLTKTEY